MLALQLTIGATIAATGVQPVWARMLSVDSRLPLLSRKMLLFDQTPPRTRNAAPEPLVLNVNPFSPPDSPRVRMALPGLLPLLIGTADPCHPSRPRVCTRQRPTSRSAVSAPCFGIRLSRTKVSFGVVEPAAPSYPKQPVPTAFV